MRLPEERLQTSHDLKIIEIITRGEPGPRDRIIPWVLETVSSDRKHDFSLDAGVADKNLVSCCWTALVF